MLKDLKTKINSVMDDEAFTELYLELQNHDRAQLFEAIWPIAVSEPVDDAPTSDPAQTVTRTIGTRILVKLS